MREILEIQFYCCCCCFNSSYILFQAEKINTKCFTIQVVWINTKFVTIKIEGMYLASECTVYFVTTKTKIHINPKQNDKYLCSTAISVHIGRLNDPSFRRGRGSNTTIYKSMTNHTISFRHGVATVSKLPGRSYLNDPSSLLLSSMVLPNEVSAVKNETSFLWKLGHPSVVIVDPCLLACLSVGMNQ